MDPKEFDALYQPSYFPELAWLKTKLLLWDRIFRIVPYEMQDKYGDEFIEKEFGIDPSILPMESPNLGDLSGFEWKKDILRNAFAKIAMKKTNRMANQREFGIHPQKAPDWLFEMLDEFGLARDVSTSRNEWEAQHRMVHDEAGKLVLSCLGDQMASRRGLDQLTDHDLSFYVNSAGEVVIPDKVIAETSLEALLALAVFKIRVPKDIIYLPMAKVMELRKEYTELRHAFHGAILSLSTAHDLKGTVEPKFARKAINVCLEDFTEKEKKFNKSRPIKIISDWRVQSLGVMLGTIGATIAGGPAAGLIVGIGGAAIQLAHIISNPTKPSDFEKSFKYLQKLNENVEIKECLVNIQALLPEHFG